MGGIVEKTGCTLTSVGANDTIIAAENQPYTGRKQDFMQRIQVLGIPYCDTSISEAARELAALSDKPGAYTVVTPNAEIGFECLRDEVLRAAVLDADVILPDGAGVVMASIILGTPLRARVAGFDVSCSLLPLIEQSEKTLYLLGAAPGVAETAAARMRERFPALRIVGMRDGYFTDAAEAAREAAAAAPDFVFVALGSPKQELFLQRQRAVFEKGVLMGLGGSLDVFAGVAKRAPDLFIRHNLEWLYRLFLYPSRFLRMTRLPRYILRAARMRLLRR